MGQKEREKTKDNREPGKKREKKNIYIYRKYKKEVKKSPQEKKKAKKRKTRERKQKHLCL